MMGPKTTAREVISSFGATLPQQTALVTGANSGIGLELCKELVSAGCRVIALVRDEDKGGKAIRDAMSSEGIATKDLLDVRTCRLDSLGSVENCGASVVADYEKEGLDYVVYNAGIMATPSLEFTEDGFEKQIGTNHFGHAYLNSFLYEILRKQKRKSRVVTLSSTAHGFGEIKLENLNYGKGRMYTPWGAYGQSKLANLLFAKGFSNQLEKDGLADRITSLSVHPGVIRTNLWRSTPIRFLGPLVDIIGFMDKTIAQGASTSAWAMLSPRIDSEAPSFQGAYLSDCASAKPMNRQANDEKLCDDFWQVTEEQLRAARQKIHEKEEKEE